MKMEKPTGLTCFLGRFAQYVGALTLAMSTAAAAAEIDGQTVLTGHEKAGVGQGLLDGLGYVPDFSFAGYDNGDTQIPAAQGDVIEVGQFGAKPDDGIDDTKAIQAALAHIDSISGPVILRFPSGRFIITDIIKLRRSNLVLQGAGRGADGTTLYFPRPLAMMKDTSSLNELRTYLKKYDKRQREKQNNLDVLFSEYSWSGGFIWIARDDARPAPYLEKFDPPIKKLATIRKGTRGGFDIEVSNVSKLTVGDVMQVHWFNRAGKDGALIEEIYDTPNMKVGSHHWTFPDRPLVRQMVEIISIDGNSVRLKQPLLHNISKALPAQLSQWKHLSRIGVEDLHFEFPNAPNFGHHVEQGYNAIYLTSAYNSWIRNVRFTNADSGVLTYDTANATIQTVETRGERAAHYTVHIGNAHNVLVKDLTVFNRSRHTLSFNTQSTRCVYSGATLYTEPVLDQHAGSNHQNLFDNVTTHVSAQKGKDGAWAYPLYDGSGAGYWQPGHGAFNTSWNIHVVVEGGPHPHEKLRIDAVDEGPNGRIVGLHGNRALTLDYRPSPAVARLNEAMTDIPSLYEFLLSRRISRKSMQSTP